MAGYGCQLYNREKGYGRIGRGGRGSMSVASRISWELYRGPIPDGLHVLHKCDNPPCVNPEHLELGTHAKNMFDAYQRGRDRRSENNQTAILTNDQVHKIRGSSLTCRSLAKNFGVSYSLISTIKRRKIWRYLP